MISNIKNRRKFFLIFGLFLCLIPISIISFYVRFEMVSSWLKNEMGYEGGAANAVKHSYASAEIYRFFRYFIEAKHAEAAVIGLGVINERAEIIVKFKNPDSYEEILKDLHNNMTGLAASEWKIQNAPKEPMLEILLKLKDHKTLIVQRDENPLFNKSTFKNDGTVDEAVQWFDSHKETIRERVYSDLDKLVDESEGALGSSL